MATQKSKPTPAATNIATAFEIPSKQRKPIPIMNPDSKDERRASQSLESTEVKSTYRPSLQPALPASHKGLIAQSPTSHGTRPSFYTDQAGLTDTTNLHTNKPRANIECVSVTQSMNNSLDIFAPNYIPRWLLAVNTSQAQLQPCVPFPGIDFVSYISTFVGPDFAKDVNLAIVPHLIHPGDFEPDPLPQTYTLTWFKHLQVEFTLQRIQHHAFAMYNQLLQAESGRDGYFRLHVPGLLENAPRIDLGDVVHIRLLQASATPHETRVNYWLNHGRKAGAICPGFSGLIYDPCVWEINRAKEFITLRMETFPRSGHCNVVFSLQESKLEPIYRAIQTDIRGNPWLRKMLFPKVEEGEIQYRLSPGSFDIHWVDQLNWEQKKAVHSVFSANYGTLPYLIWGPPGTGKTKTLVEIAIQLLQKPGHILICAPSDAAADTLALRLSAHLSPSDLFRLNNWTRSFAEVPDGLMHYTYTNESSFSLPSIDRLLRFRVVVTTCRDADLLNKARITNVSLGPLFNGVTRILSPGSPRHCLHWTSLLLDEAAQATEPDALIPLTVVMPPDDVQCPQFVAAGDQYQLGPKLLSRSNLAISLFQRLFGTELYLEHPLSRKHGTRVVTQKMLPMIRPAFSNLVRNYRSHPAILSVPSSLFYSDTLITERKTSKEILEWPGWPSQEGWPVLFKQNSSEDAYESLTDGDGTGSGALFNPGEAAVALSLVQSLLQHVNDGGQVLLKQNEIMIMSPFRKQVSFLRNTFRRSNLFDVNIGPLEAFQGLESRIVIICTTRTRIGGDSQPASHYVAVDKRRGLGVIDEPQRLNVAMTRAQEGLIVIGNAECLTSTKDHQWLNFIDYCRRNDCYETPIDFTWPDLGGPYQQGRLERALIYAALGRAEAEAKEDHIGKPGVASASNHRFSLRGPQQEMDEEMWQFKEIAQLYDSENVDVILGDVETESDTNGDEDCFVEREDENVQEGGYDRNLKQELHRECNTQ